MLINDFQILYTGLESDLKAAVDLFDTTVKTECDAALAAISVYREEAYAAVGETVDLTALTAAATEGSAEEQAQALNDLQVVIDSVESNVTGQISEGVNVGTLGQPNDLRIARAAIIAALYAAYQAQYDVLNP